MSQLNTNKRYPIDFSVWTMVCPAASEEADSDWLLAKVELLARVRAVLRRASWHGSQVGTPREVLQYGALELDSEAQSVICRGKRLKLTRTEYDLLHYFMRNAGKALPHRSILQNVWGPEYGNEAKYLRVYIGRLRRKIEADPTNPQYLLTEYGIGYRFGE